MKLHRKTGVSRRNIFARCWQPPLRRHAESATATETAEAAPPVPNLEVLALIPVAWTRLSSQATISMLMPTAPGQEHGDPG